MFKDLVPYLKFHLKVCDFLRCTPFQYNEKSGRLYQTKSAKRIKISQCLTILHLLVTGAMTIHLFVSKMHYTNKLQGSLFVVMYIAQSVGRTYENVDSSPIQLVNAILNFEAQLVKGTQIKWKVNTCIFCIKTL
jgi:hypothetical protein